MSFRSHARCRWPHVVATVLAACALLPLTLPQAATADATPSIEWPTEWDGVPLRPLALSAVEHRFAQRFPGQIARFTDDRSRVVVLRHVTQPTRMLHPAADCFRATGYRIDHARLERDEQARLWRCFDAQRDVGAEAGQRLRVCERIESVGGMAGSRHAGTSIDASTSAPISSHVGAQGHPSSAPVQSFTDASSWFWAATLGKSRGPWQAVTVVEAL